MRCKAKSWACRVRPHRQPHQHRRQGPPPRDLTGISASRLPLPADQLRLAPEICAHRRLGQVPRLPDPCGAHAGPAGAGPHVHRLQRVAIAPDTDPRPTPAAGRQHRLAAEDARRSAQRVMHEGKVAGKVSSALLATSRIWTPWSLMPPDAGPLAPQQPQPVCILGASCCTTSISRWSTPPGTQRNPGRRHRYQPEARGRPAGRASAVLPRKRPAHHHAGQPVRVLAARRPRRYIVENPKRNRVEDYQSSNDAYVVEDIGLAPWSKTSKSSRPKPSRAAVSPHQAAASPQLPENASCNSPAQRHRARVLAARLRLKVRSASRSRAANTS
jgi:hypothetical protein